MLVGLLGAHAPVIAVLLAQATGGGSGGAGTPGFPWGDVLKIGVTPVVVVVLLGMRIFRIGPDVDRQMERIEKSAADRLGAETARAERAEKQLIESQERERRLRDVAEDKFLPVLASTKDTLERVLDFLMDTRLPPRHGPREE